MRCFIFIVLVSFVACIDPTTIPQIADKDDYYSNGRIRIEKNTKGDSAHWIFRREFGGCWEEKFFYKGNVYKTIGYSGDCKKESEIEFLNGQRHGIFRTWNSNGKVDQEATYYKGIPVGNFRVYNQIGMLTRTDYHSFNYHLVDSLIPFACNLAAAKKYLEPLGLTNYREDDNVEVAGRDYYFPVLMWGESKLDFDERQADETTIRLERGVVRDAGFVLNLGIEVGMEKSLLWEKLNLTIDTAVNSINFHDTITTTEKFFSFDFSDGKLAEFEFSACTD